MNPLRLIIYAAYAPVWLIMALIAVVKFIMGTASNFGKYGVLIVFVCTILLQILHSLLK